MEGGNAGVGEGSMPRGVYPPFVFSTGPVSAVIGVYRELNSVARMHAGSRAR